MPETSATSPRRVLLFSGHMIDATGRDRPRFPPQHEGTARLAIAQLLQELDAGPEDRKFKRAFFSRRPPGNALDHPLVRSLDSAAAC